MSITVLNPKSFSNTTAEVDAAAVKPLPNSRKIYVQGSRADIQVPMREIRQSDTTISTGAEKNPPIWVYDTSGLYSDPAIKIDIRSGLPALREKWIDERNDTEILSGLNSAYSLERLKDPKLAETTAPQQGRIKCHTDALCTPWHHYTRNGVYRDSRESAR